MLNQVNLDLGFGHGKAKNDRMEVSIPSVVGPARKLIDTNVSDKEPLANIVDKKRDWFIGDLALRQSATKNFSLSDNKANHKSTLSFLETMLGILAPSQEINVVTGLPVTFFHNQKKEMEKLIKRDHEINIEVGGHWIERTVSVIDIKIVPQPLGAALDYLLDNHGQLKEDVKQIAKGRIGVLDIGFFTNDLLVLDGLEVNNDLSRSLRSGLSVAYKAMNDAGIDLPIYELDKKVREGQYKTAAIKAFEALSQQIMGEIETYWRDIDLVIVTGGGGSALNSFLQLPYEKTLSYNSAMSNVRGYHKLGRRTWG